MHMLKSNQQ